MSETEATTDSDRVEPTPTTADDGEELAVADMTGDDHPLNASAKLAVGSTYLDDGTQVLTIQFPIAPPKNFFQKMEAHGYNLQSARSELSANRVQEFAVELVEWDIQNHMRDPLLEDTATSVGYALTSQFDDSEGILSRVMTYRFTHPKGNDQIAYDLRDFARP